MSIDEAITQFRSAAIEKADWAEPGNRDRALFEQMEAAWRNLNQYGAEGRQAFKGLLIDESRHVRGWVAAQLLGSGDQSGVPMLEAESLEPGMRGFTADMVLREWRGGRLKPPFTETDA
jgi:hypothetical protein